MKRSSFLSLALAALGLMAGAHAQTGPLPTSPAVPTPYQSPLFHAGGAPPPPLFPVITPPATDPLFDPLFGQLQGTPTGLTPGGLTTQIPSFLLGNYSPTLPPAGAGIYYPDHFADGNIFAWQAPFDYIPASASAITVDDTDTINFTTTGFVNIATGNVAGTATGSEYDRLPPSTNGSASWTLTAAVAGSYSVYFHIPDNIDDGLTGGGVEQRGTSVNYTLVVTGTGAQTTTATASQTEANSLQYLAGPFQLAAGNMVTVTLQRDTTHNQANVLDYLIADSMTLQASIGDVRSTPTAINTTAYPADFANVKYWGIAAGGLPATTGSPTTLLAANAPPDTGAGVLPILRTGSAPVDADHLVRQLVYFGRSEPSISSSAIVDNTDTAFTSSGGWSSAITDATATNGSYIHVAPTNGSASSTATWTLTAPTGGNYFLSVHLPKTLAASEQRITDATYTVTYPNLTGAGTTTKSVKASQVTGIGADANVFLPTGPIALAAGAVVTVVLGNNTASALPGTPPYEVVADSVTMATSPGTGAIYCVDGFTGEVVWRFETPPSATGPSAPVFSSPAIAKINVLTGFDPVTKVKTYANKLVVIVGDDNGLVYCLDAIGNGDGTSNGSAISSTTGQPIYFPQPVYGTAPPAQVTAGVAITNPHVGTTPFYWIYRPDRTKPKNIATGAVKTTPDPLSDLPVPAAFGTASPTIFVDPSVAIATTGAATATSNATVFVGNSNGVLYALDALGVPVDGTSAATFAGTGDTFNVSQDLRAAATDAAAPTCQPKWWFSLRGPSPNAGSGATSADIESAPAISVAAAAGVYTPTVYIGSAHEQESTSNIGRLYALNGLLGPSGNNGQNYPTAATGAPGSLNYNVGQRPQISKIDPADWSFPDAYGTDTYTTGKSSTGKPRPALGNITGSPVVFTDTNEGTTTHQTRIYFAASTGLETPYTVSGGTPASAPAARPDDTQTGRVWAVNQDGSVGTTTNSAASGSIWAYPLAHDPNDATQDNIPEPFPPIGSFLHATPAIGFVQFPAVVTAGTGTYAPTDAVQTGGILGKSVPMLYIGTRGVNDTSLYAVDIDGNMNGTGPVDQRTIYRQISPDGAIFQSSPVLVTNATSAGGNGGAVYITGGNTLYDFGATPISNPISTEAFPLIRENRALIGFGPISSPTVAAADVSDLTPTFTTYGGANVTDWVYVGDSSTGYCRGITPNDTTDTGIPPDLGTGILPPNPEPPAAADLNSLLHTYLVAETDKASPDYTKALPIGPTAALPVYEWGQNVYIRIANVVPPQPAGSVTAASPGGNPAFFVHDSGVDPTLATPAAPVTIYSCDPVDGKISFDLADASADTSTTVLFTDHAIIPAVLLTALPGDGIIARTDAVATPPVPNLVASNATPYTQYIGAYTYAIGDGTARKNTPGGRRKLLNVQQTVHAYSFDGTNYTPTGTVILTATATNGNEVSVLSGGSYTFKTVPPVDQPTFGILNPLGVRAGGVPLSLASGTSSAVEIGDALGPFRGTAATLPAVGGSGDFGGLEALANGNSIYTQGAPPSTSLPTDPIALPLSTAENPPTAPKTVVTSTGLINHNQGGDNTDPSTAPLPTGAYPTGLVGTNFGSPNAPYAFDLFDRSTLSFVAKTLRVKMGQPGTTGREGLYWNDNSTNTTGHDSVVNFLPWETPPLSYKNGANTSPDYPNISGSNIAFTLHADDANGGSSGSMNGDAAIPTPVTGVSTDVMHRTVYASPIQVHVDVPLYQPANQQVYSKNLAGGGGYSTVGETTPGGIHAATNTVFPMGYVTTKRLYVPNAAGRYDSGCAFRDVSIYTGVPPSISASISDGTLDIGAVPSGFGIQTSSYAPLGGSLEFTPYNAAYQSYYLPVTVHNNGNVNMLNVHFDQKYALSNSFAPILFQSDAVDPLSAIPAFDTTGATGPRTGTFNSVSEMPFLLRTSVDTDLGQAYGRNPGIVANSLAPYYPSTTFHKPLVGGVATTLTVPDVPYNNVPGTTFGLVGNDGKPLTASGSVAVNNVQFMPDGVTPNLDFGKAATAQPYVSLAIPFGTPFGTYSQTIRLFEGMDTSGYTTYNGSNQAYNPLYPPQYGSAVGGLGTPGSVSDVYAYGAQPISDPGVVVKANVLEDRMTDGNTFGSLPEIDASPAGTTTGGGAASTPDFAPAALQAAGGNLSVFWTSGRGKPGSYGIYGSHVPFITPNAGAGYYYPGNPAAQWFTPINPSLMAGTNSGLTIASDVPALSAGGGFTYDTAHAYAFAVNVNTAPYQNALYCYPMTPSSGALAAGQLVTSDPSQVKYGVRGLYAAQAGFPGNRSLWAFWTASTRGRTAIYYNSREPGAGNWPNNSALLPIPAGLTAVSDAYPTLIYAPVTTNTGATSTTALKATIEVTFSGTGADGNADLYLCRYTPDANTLGLLDLQSFQQVTEQLQPVAGWLQSRDVAWSRTGVLNVFVNSGTTASPNITPVLYDASNAPLFKNATFDKASGLLVFSGVGFTGVVGGTNTLYVDLSTGRLRFVTPPTGLVTATFTPQARRITDDARADTGVVTFLDPTFKDNESRNVPGAITAAAQRVQTDRRWYFWRKAGVSDDTTSATLYQKAQRLTVFLPRPVDVTQTITVTVNGAAYTGAYDVSNLPTSARLYFPITSGGGQWNEGQTVTVTYKATDGTGIITPQDTIQWQDELRANDVSVPPTDAASGLATVVDTKVAMDKRVNENNVSAFLDVNAYNDLAGGSAATDAPHKIWLFWNSTRNGTADLYYETINPRFTAAGP